MMKRDNPVREKSYSFALRMIRLYKYLTDDKREFLLAKQVLRSGTSIGANVEEALGGQSKKDFISKLSVAYKEARETEYWLRLLTDSGFLSAKESRSVLTDCRELLKLLTKILRTSRTKSVHTE